MGVENCDKFRWADVSDRAMDSPPVLVQGVPMDPGPAPSWPSPWPDLGGSMPPPPPPLPPTSAAVPPTVPRLRWRWIPGVIVLLVVVGVVVATPTVARHGIGVAGVRSPWPEPVPEFECNFEHACAIPALWGGIAWLVVSGVAVVLALIGGALGFARPTAQRVGLVLGAIALVLAVGGFGLWYGSIEASYQCARNDENC